MCGRIYPPFLLSPSRTEPQHRSSCRLADAAGHPGLCCALLLGLQAEQWLLPETHRVSGPLLPYTQLQHSTVRRKRPHLRAREEQPVRMKWVRECSGYKEQRRPRGESCLRCPLTRRHDSVNCAPVLIIFQALVFNFNQSRWGLMYSFPLTVAHSAKGHWVII